MSNRKTRKKAQKRTQAPQDAADGVEAPATRPRRTTWQWVVLGFKVTAGLALLVSAVGTLAWGVNRYAQTTPRFAIVHLQVEGTKRLSRADVLRGAGVQKGQNLFSLDVAAAERTLVESPWISSAQVTRRLPNTVKLQVVERDPRAIATISGKNFLVAHDGTPFKELGSGDPHDFPIITGTSLDAMAKDRRAELERLQRTLSLLRDYEDLSLGRSLPVQEIHLSDTGAVSLTIGEKGVALHLGKSPWKKKLLRAERVLSKARRSGGSPQVVFLDNEAHPERVVVRVQ